MTDLLVAAHHRLIFWFLQRYFWNRDRLYLGSNTRDDVAQGLLLGLKDAVVAYGESTAKRELYTFSTFAYYHFLASLKTHLLQGTTGVQAARIIETMQKIREIKQHYKNYQIFDVTDEDIVSAYNTKYPRDKITLDKYREFEALATHDNLKLQTGNRNSSDKGDRDTFDQLTFLPTNDPNPEEAALSNDNAVLRELMEKYLKDDHPKLYEVLLFRYGFVSPEPVSYTHLTLPTKA